MVKLVKRGVECMGIGVDERCMNWWWLGVRNMDWRWLVLVVVVVVAMMVVLVGKVYEWQGGIDETPHTPPQSPHTCPETLLPSTPTTTHLIRDGLGLHQHSRVPYRREDVCVVGLGRVHGLAAG